MRHTRPRLLGRAPCPPDSCVPSKRPSRYDHTHTHTHKARTHTMHEHLHTLTHTHKETHRQTDRHTRVDLEARGMRCCRVHAMCMYAYVWFIQVAELQKEVAVALEAASRAPDAVRQLNERLYDLSDVRPFCRETQRERETGR
jgi:hypothetical protein